MEKILDVKDLKVGKLYSRTDTIKINSNDLVEVKQICVDKGIIQYGYPGMNPVKIDSMNISEFITTFPYIPKMNNDDKLQTLLSPSTSKDFKEEVKMQMVEELISYVKANKLSIVTLSYMISRLFQFRRGFKYFRENVFSSCRNPNISKEIADSTIIDACFSAYKKIYKELIEIAYPLSADRSQFAHDFSVLLAKDVDAKIVFDSFVLYDSPLRCWELIVLSRCAETMHITMDFKFPVRSIYEPQEALNTTKQTSFFNK